MPHSLIYDLPIKPTEAENDSCFMSAPAGMRALTGACYARGLRPDAAHAARLCRLPPLAYRAMPKLYTVSVREM
jgi:hypothetical protein